MDLSRMRRHLGRAIVIGSLLGAVIGGVAPAQIADNPAEEADAPKVEVADTSAGTTEPMNFDTRTPSGTDRVVDGSATSVSVGPCPGGGQKARLGLLNNSEAHSPCDAIGR